MQESNALAAVLLKAEQIFTVNQPNYSLDPAALLAILSNSESEEVSDLEIHLLSIESNSKKPILVLLRRLNADERLLLAFSSETSLTVAEQSIAVAIEGLSMSNQPHPALLDLSKLQLRQVSPHQEPTWQDELFAMDVSPAVFSEQASPSFDEVSKSNSVPLPSEKPYWYQVF